MNKLLGDWPKTSVLDGLENMINYLNTSNKINESDNSSSKKILIAPSSFATVTNEPIDKLKEKGLKLFLIL